MRSCTRCGTQFSRRSRNARICQPCADAILKCRICGGTILAGGLSVCGKHLEHELGITYRQLDFWTRSGYLRPEWPQGAGSGTPRRWPESELAAARLIGRLVAAGMTAGRAAWLVRQDQPRTEIAPGIWIEVTL